MTNIEPRHAWVVIRYLIGKRSPRIDMYNLSRCSSGQCLAHIHVIQLLTVHIKDITISLCLGSAYNIIEILELRNISEGLERGNESEFVEVAAGNDTGVTVFLEDRRDEGLEIMLGCLFLLRNEPLTAVALA